MPVLRHRPASPAVNRLKHQQARRALRFLLVGAAAMYFALAALHYMAMPEATAITMGGVAFVSAIVCVLARMHLVEITRTFHRTMVAEAGVMSIIVANTVIHGILIPSAHLSTTMALVMIAAAICAHTLAVVGATGLVMLVSTVYVLLTDPIPHDTNHFVIHFCFAALLSALVFRIRMAQLRDRAAIELRRDRAMRHLESQTQRLRATGMRAQEAAHRADAASRAKSEFLANMSHELRTPLNAIIGFAEMMERKIFGPLGNERYEGYATNIRTSGTYLLELVNDVLDLSKIEANKFELHPEPLDLAEAIDNCAAMIESQAAQRGVEFEVGDVPPGAVVEADARAVQQILLNLLSNAVKFTEGGGKVRLDVVHAIGNWRIRVRDTGVGIAEHDMERVLAPFGQVANAMTRAEHGTGLGLPLTKSLTEMMAGEFRIDSAPGVGTTVTVDLPRATGRRGQAPMQAAQPA